MFYAEFTEPNMAIDTEKQIKKWSRAKKEALINNEFDKLPNLAKKKFNSK
ncbi:MAG: putative endonuclease containing URI domain [Flavobacteriaceae bacterium FS1-H7996/R]|jgi:putative endonuclease|nr:MAG: putative endonuclease containing URI domain [Flavobacteriaceae bacterium FS1-H7996/R]